MSGLLLGAVVCFALVGAVVYAPLRLAGVYGPQDDSDDADDGIDVGGPPYHR